MSAEPSSKNDVSCAMVLIEPSSHDHNEAFWNLHSAAQAFIPLQTLRRCCSDLLNAFDRSSANSG
jgi:hypothetical protein